LYQERARALLVQSDMTITQIAVACGFQSACHFSKSYRALYGRSPRSERHQPLFGDAANAPAGRRRDAIGTI
jgi:AraC family transcriptional regulator, glycine betaine-responsive activator